MVGTLMSIMQWMCMVDMNGPRLLCGTCKQAVDCTEHPGNRLHSRPPPPPQPPPAIISCMTLCSAARTAATTSLPIWSPHAPPPQPLLPPCRVLPPLHLL
jgi:hypothetical protein